VLMPLEPVTVQRGDAFVSFYPGGCCGSGGCEFVVVWVVVLQGVGSIDIESTITSVALLYAPTLANQTKPQPQPQTPTTTSILNPRPNP